MSANRYQPHLLILPEDAANSDVASGFLKYPALSTRNIQVMPEAGGWNAAVRSFLEDEVRGMERFANRFVVLLIDFDDDPGRMNAVKSQVPEHLADRVFVLGSLSDPEALKREMRESPDEIGLRMAKDCHQGTDAVWGHPLLKHNADELARLQQPHVRQILFPLEAGPSPT